MNKKNIITIIAATGLLVTIGGITVESLNNKNNKDSINYIEEQAAKEIAFTDANLKETEVENLTIKLDTEDLIKEYDIEFFHNNIEYDYEINALTGTIIGKDQEKQMNDVSTKEEVTTYIGEAKAKEIALKAASVTSSSITNYTCVLDSDDGVKEYDIEFNVGNTEYDYEINALTGAIISSDKEIKQTTTDVSTKEEVTTYIGEAKAKEIALKHANLTTSAITNYTCELDLDDGQGEYEIEWNVGTTEYDYTIQASSGSIIEYSVEKD